MDLLSLTRARSFALTSVRRFVHFTPPRTRIRVPRAEHGRGGTRNGRSAMPPRLIPGYTHEQAYKLKCCIGWESLSVYILSMSTQPNGRKFDSQAVMEHKLEVLFNQCSISVCKLVLESGRDSLWPSPKNHKFQGEAASTEERLRSPSLSPLSFSFCGE